jgi:hypothetical protein
MNIERPICAAARGVALYWPAMILLAADSPTYPAT